ncbi:MAG: insulinase family protein [Elusimicrobiota bacterium]|jgi:predicted Zn-dependent peptidase|nr:insulinase family protein [Elusimicrobiota bacterium]
MQIFNLKNNIKVLFEKTGGAKVFSLKIFSPISATSEDISKAGVCALTNNLMQKATMSRSKERLAKDIDDIGASLSSLQDYDFSCLSIDCLSEFFVSAAEILSDIIINPSFSADELAFEKEMLKAFFKSNQDDIKSVVGEHFAKNFYNGSSYQYHYCGSPDTTDNINLDDIKAMHKFSYNASNILISIAGNIDFESVKNVLERNFGSIKEGQKFKEPQFAVKSPSKEKEIIDGKFNQAFILTGFPVSSLRDKNFAAISVLSNILGGRMTSRLFIELREKLGLAYEVGSSYNAKLVKSHFSIYIGLDKKNIDLTLKRIDEILKNFCAKGVGKEELNNVKTYIKGIYALSRLTTSAKSRFYGLKELLWGDYAYDESYLNEVESVNEQTIREIANEIFKQKSFTIILKPKKEI